MTTRPYSPTHSAASTAVRFHVNLADRTEEETVDRYLRRQRLVADVVDAARRADAIRRLEQALTRSMPARFTS